MYLIWFRVLNSFLLTVQLHQNKFAGRFAPYAILSREHHLSITSKKDQP